MKHPTEEKITIGQYIRTERINYMTLRSFAKDLGVSASYLSDLERDNRKASKNMIMKIAATFKVAIGGSARQRYDRMLQLAGLMTHERRCLKVLWQGLKVLTYDPMLQNWMDFAEESLYCEIDGMVNHLNSVDGMKGGGE